MISTARIAAAHNSIGRLQDRSLNLAIDAEHLLATHQHGASIIRGYLFNPTPDRLGELSYVRADLASILARMRSEHRSSVPPEVLEAVRDRVAQTDAIADRLIARRNAGADLEEIRKGIVAELYPARTALDASMWKLVAAARQEVTTSREAMQELVDESVRLNVIASASSVVALLGLIALLTFVVRSRARASRVAEHRAAELQAVMDSLPDAVFVGDPAAIHSANAAALVVANVAEVAGLPKGLRGLVESLHITDAETGLPIPTSDTSILRALSGHPQTQEVVMVGPGGQPIIAQCSAAPVDVDGTTVAVAVVVSDITALRTHERRLRESQATFAGIVAIAPDAIIAIDEDQRITVFNYAAEEIFGWRAEEVLGKPLDVLLPEDVRELHREHVARTASGPDQMRGIHQRRQIRGVRKNGTEFPAEAGISKHTAGGRTLMTVVLRDVSERRRQEREQAFLAKATDLLSESLDYRLTLGRVAELMVPELGDGCGVFVVDGEDIRLAALSHKDSAAAEILRSVFERSPIPADSAQGIAHAIRCGEPQYLPEISPELMRELASYSEAYSAFERVTCRSIFTVPLRARGKTVAAISVWVGADGRTLDERTRELIVELGRRAAAAIDNGRLYDDSQRATKARDEILAIVAHDLRNPVNSIGLQMRVLERRLSRLTPAEPEIQSAMAPIFNASKRMTRLIDDLLDVVQIDHGRLSIVRQRLDSRRVLKDAFAANEAAAAAAKVRMEITEEGALGEISADPDRMQQVLGNLIGNALKFTPEGGVITLGAAANSGAGEVSFWVSDTGPGIGPEDVEHVFDPFWKGSRADRRGAGLGLAICRGIVEAHGGRIKVESVIGTGSTFTLTLPCTCVADRAKAEGCAAGECSRGAPTVEIRRPDVRLPPEPALDTPRVG